MLRLPVVFYVDLQVVADLKSAERNGQLPECRGQACRKTGITVVATR